MFDKKCHESELKLFFFFLANLGEKLTRQVLVLLQ